jgi:hypothetical protein
MRVWGSLVLALAMLLGATPASASRSSPPPASPAGQILSRPALPVTTLDVGPVPGAEKTRIHWTRLSRRVVYGEATVLEGQVVVGEGDQSGAVPDAEVDLYARRAGSTDWQPVGTAVSSSDRAVFVFHDHVPSANTDYRVTFEGDLFYASSEATRRVDVARRVPDALRRIDASHFALRGSVAPTYRQGGVVLQRKTCRGCSWSTLAYERTTSRSRWSFGVSVPRERGTWYYRVVVPADRLFVRSVSNHVWALTRR